MSVDNSQPEDIEPDPDQQQDDNAPLEDGNGSESGSESYDEESEEEVTPAVIERSRRANAGSRLRALLDQEQPLEEEEIFAEEEDDKDFFAKEEKDVFDSDFEETSSEEGEDEIDPNAPDAGERRLAREEKLARRAAREKEGKKRKKPFYAFERSAAARKRENGEARQAKKRRFELGGPGRTVGERASKRTLAVQYSKQVDEREAEDLKRKQEMEAKLEERRKKRKAERAKVWTQTDLVEEALKTEEINKASLAAFYQAEEERKMSHVTGLGGYGIYGPRITFLSTTKGTSKHKCELILGPQPPEAVAPADVEESVPAVQSLAQSTSALQSLPQFTSPLPHVYQQEEQKPVLHGARLETPAQPPQQPIVNGITLPVTATIRATQATLPHVNGHGGPGPNGILQSMQGSTIASTSATAPAPAPLTALAPTKQAQELEQPTTVEIEDPYTANYLLVAELELLDDFKNMKASTCQAIFGDHTDWSVPRATNAKHRPPKRDTMCPITGLKARYRDPQTLTPYATKEALEVIRRVQCQGAEGGFVWSPHFQCFVRPAPVRSLSPTTPATAPAQATDPLLASTSATMDVDDVKGNGTVETVEDQQLLPTSIEPVHEQDEDKIESLPYRGTLRQPYRPGKSDTSSTWSKKGKAKDGSTPLKVEKVKKTPATKPSPVVKEKPVYVPPPENKERIVPSRRARPSVGVMKDS